MGQSSSNNDMLNILQLGFDKVNEEIYELERKRDKLYKDVNLKKELERLTVEVNILGLEKTKLSEEIQFEVAEKANTVKTTIERDIKPLQSTQKKALALVASTNKELQALRGTLDKLESEIKVKTAQRDGIDSYVIEEKGKLAKFSEGVKNKVAETTANLDVKEVELTKRESKLEVNISYLSGREEKVKVEEKANDELIKSLLKDLEYREQGLVNAKAQLETEENKSKERIDKKLVDLNKKEVSLKEELNSVKRESASLEVNLSSVVKREEIVTSREKDLEVNWGAFVKEQGKFREQKRKFLSK